ncbi:PTS system beta-glucoside-specific EIIBCA component [Eubacterium plexicaudatum ASF492]|uniref:PTS system, glucose-like IIB component n=1 Tax=Eubacterium plexicaudatum ASF492 TaxID=1235802 RepID=N2BDB5_9FIRM|nr:PTS system beta-glucoside-specific EIIBCA component [Eubacterium plexicaudatum ASF492]
MAKYTEFCEQILEKVGGKDNISNALHCMTRLRLNLKDRSKIDIGEVKGIKGVLGAQFSGEQFQIIIGQHVSEVYPEFCAMAGLGAAQAVDENLDEKEPFDIKKVPAKLLDYVSGSIAPTLPIMMGAGFFKMFYAILGPDLLKVLPNESALMQTLYIVGNAGFYFMPIFVAWGAAKKLNTSIPIAMLLSCLLIDPNILNLVEAGEPFNVYGFIPMQLNNYTQSVLPSLLMVFALSYVFRFFDQYIPRSIKIIGVPFATMFIMLPLTFCVLAPIGNWMGMGLSTFFSAVYDIAGPLAIALIAAFWPFLVATGMHIAVIQIALLNLTTLGYDPIVLAGSNIANYALMGMAVAYFLRTKGEEKQMAGANVITLIVGGISEPTLFGVLLRNKRAMICQIVGGFIGGLVGGILKVAVYTMGAANFLTVLQYAGGPGTNFVYACIACAAAFVAAAAVGIVIGFGDGGDGLKNFKGKKAKKA